MQILKSPVPIDELKTIAVNLFGDMVKAVVDVNRQLVAVDAELHSDLEALLIKEGSKQNGLWGVNFYPDMKGEDFIEFDSMINLRPSQGNKSRGVDSADLRSQILHVVDQWIKR